MAVCRLQEAELGAFMATLVRRYGKFAPVRTHAVRFQQMQDGEVIDPTENSYRAAPSATRAKT